MKKQFGELVVTRVKKHKFWGMNINITEDKKVEIAIKEQLWEAMEVFGENVDEQLTSPAYSHLFVFNEQAQQLDE